MALKSVDFYIRTMWLPNFRYKYCLFILEIKTVFKNVKCRDTAPLKFVLFVFSKKICEKPLCTNCIKRFPATGWVHHWHVEDQTWGGGGATLAPPICLWRWLQKLKYWAQNLAGLKLPTKLAVPSKLQVSYYPWFSRFDRKVSFILYCYKIGFY